MSAAHPATSGGRDRVAAPRIGRRRAYAVARLRLTLSARLTPRDRDHIAALAACFDDLPPIVVLEPGRVVVDGLHRVMAARQLGRETIDGVAFTGTAEDAYVEAVRANVTHGKALTLEERRAAVRRILGTHPDWSDRRVARVCGLAGHTVAEERQRSRSPVAGVRVGADGRARPVDPAAGRLRVAELLAGRPDLSLRRLAAEAGTSQATALDVRRRVASGAGPLPPRLQVGRTAPAPPACDDLASDAALTGSDDGRSFLDWFERHRIGEDALDRAALVPRGRIYAVADEANRQSKLWARLAAELERRSGTGAWSAT
ncbi:MAG TPA: hypothetical protein VFM27_15035 [Acidimicrobiales bacterium]|nr:hypothetical protein [Acidimicrobiales bacterium]